MSTIGEVNHSLFGSKIPLETMWKSKYQIIDWYSFNIKKLSLSSYTIYIIPFLEENVTAVPTSQTLEDVVSMSLTDWRPWAESYRPILTWNQTSPQLLLTDTVMQCCTNQFFAVVWGYLSLTHSFAIISENVAINHSLPKTRFFALHFLP